MPACMFMCFVIIQNQYIFVLNVNTGIIHYFMFDWLSQTCLNVRWASPDRRFIPFSKSGCSVHTSQSTDSKYSPSEHHYEWLPKGDLLQDASPQPTHPSQFFKEWTPICPSWIIRWSCVTVFEDWQIDCLWTLSQITLSPYTSPFCLLCPCPCICSSSPFSHVFPFSSIISVTSHPQADWHLSKNIYEPSFRPSKTGKPHKNVNMWKRRE